MKKKELEKVKCFNFLKDQHWRLNSLYYIKDEQGKHIKFRFNEVQEMLYRNMHYLNVILKARQFGITTFVSILGLDTALFEMKDVGFCAHTMDDAKKIFNDKVKYAWDNLPEWLKNEYEVDMDNVRTLNFKRKIDGNKGMVYVDTSLRGGTYQFIHLCLSKDTEVLQKKGYVKKITDFKSGDYVLNGKGSYSLVKGINQTKLSDLKEKMFSLKVFGDYNLLKLTENHKILIKEHRTGKEIWRKIKEIKRGDYIGYPIREWSKRNKSLLVGDKKINLDYNLGFLGGLYCAEGYIRNSEIILALHRNEIKNIEKKIKIFKNYYNFYRVDYSKKSKTACIVINSKELAGFLTNYFGKGKEKFISDSIWKYGKDFMNGVLFGYFYGDGCFKNKYEISIVSVRRQLISQIKLLLISLRYGYPTIYNKKAGNYYNRNCQEIWTLKLMGNGNWKFRKKFGLELPQYNTKVPTKRKFWKRGKNFYWAKITDIKEIKPEKFVYDIILDGKIHNFLTTSGLVHNSELGTLDQKYPEKSKELRTGALNTVHAGNTVFIESTAKGQFGAFYDICQEAEAIAKEEKELGPLDYKFIFFPWFLHQNYKDETPSVIPREEQDYFEKIEKQLGITLTRAQKVWYVKKKKTQKEEMFAEFPSTSEEAFRASVEGSYYGKQIDWLREHKRIIKVPYDPKLKVDTWWDLGISKAADTMVIWFTQQYGFEIRVIDCYGNSGEGLAHYAKVLEKKPYAYNSHNAPHDIEVKEIGTGKTRLETAISLGLNFNVMPRLALEDGIEAVRNVLPKCWFDEENCHTGLTALSEYRKEWDDKLGTWKNTPLKNWASHYADAFRMMAIGIRDQIDTATIGMDDYEKEQFYKKQQVETPTDPFSQFLEL